MNEKRRCRRMFIIHISAHEGCPAIFVNVMGKAWGEGKITRFFSVPKSKPVKQL